jgi:hypothetical protein
MNCIKCGCDLTTHVIEECSVTHTTHTVIDGVLFNPYTKGVELTVDWSATDKYFQFEEDSDNTATGKPFYRYYCRLCGKKYNKEEIEDMFIKIYKEKLNV